MKSLLRAFSQIKVGKGVNVRNIAKIVSFNSNTHSKSERVSLSTSLRLVLSSVDLIVCTRLTSAHTSISQSTMTEDVTIQSFQDDSYFCSGPNTSKSNSCSRSARESAAPFPVQTGREIFWIEHQAPLNLTTATQVRSQSQWLRVHPQPQLLSQTPTTSRNNTSTLSW